MPRHYKILFATLAVALFSIVVAAVTRQPIAFACIVASVIAFVVSVVTTPNETDYS